MSNIVLDNELMKKINEYLSFATPAYMESFLKKEPKPFVPVESPKPVEGEKETYTIDEFVETFKNDPDFHKILLPDRIYEKYNLHKPTTPSLKSYLQQSIKTCMGYGSQSIIKPADDKGVRKMPFLSTVEGYDLSGNLTTYVSTFTD